MSKLPPTVNSKSSTPKSYYQDNLSFDDSPISFNCTQEGRDNLDVIWNWHSPSARPRSKITAKPRNLLASTTNLVLPLRHDNPDLEKVKNDLESLKREIGISQNNCEVETHHLITVNDELPTKLTEDLNAFLEDDTIEEEMIIASQVAEKEIFKAPHLNVDISLPDDSFDMALERLKDEDIELLSKVVTPHVKKSPLKRSPELFDKLVNEPVNKKAAINIIDSLPKQFFVPKITQKCLKTSEANKSANSIQGCSSKLFNNDSLNNIASDTLKKCVTKPPSKQFLNNTESSVNMSISSTKGNWRKSLENLTEIESTRFVYTPQTQTESCENQNKFSTVADTKTQREEDRLEAEYEKNLEQEIERKRLEAINKLEAKKLLPVPNYCQKLPAVHTQKISSNIKENAFGTENLSVEKEIERKRLEALAKLEAKKMSNFLQKQNANFINNNSNSIETSAKVSLDIEREIERKRLEALAKLEAKKKTISYSEQHTNYNQNLIETSPIKYSPEEIEKKRLEALAKLDAKKKFNFLDKKVHIHHIPTTNSVTKTSTASHQEQIEDKKMISIEKLDARQQLFSGSIKSSGSPLTRHHSTDFSGSTRVSAENSRILNNATKQKSWDEQMDERVERNRLEALRRLQLNKERQKKLP